jgi:hypothetical protein
MLALQYAAAICNDDQDVIQRAASNRGGGDGTDDVAKPEPMSVV